MGRIIAGFVAAMLAVLVFHQPAGIAAKTIGLLPATWTPYNMTALNSALPAVAGALKSLGFAGWPVIFNQLFWGGMWGILFALIHPMLPGRSMIVKGLSLGIVIAIFNWTLLPYIQGSLRGLPNQVYFGAGDPLRMAATLIFAVPFGLGTGLFYGLLRRNR
jgi:hypothetical protein